MTADPKEVRNLLPQPAQRNGHAVVGLAAAAGAAPAPTLAPARRPAGPAEGRRPAPVLDHPSSLDRQLVPLAPAQTADGAAHDQLEGARVHFRFRPERLATGSLSERPTCTFRLDAGEVGPFELLDVSSTGFALASGDGLLLAPGTVLETCHVRHRDLTLWEGRAVVVHQGPAMGAGSRVGVSLLSSLFDVQRLLLSDQQVDQRLVAGLARIRSWAEQLPEAWRAKVAMIRQHLDQARLVLEEIEASRQPAGWWRQPGAARPICEMLFARWWPSYARLVAELDAESASLSGELKREAEAYVQHELVPSYFPCPMHGRAYEKPLGYAGDYRLMELGQAEELEGESLYARFLHHLGQYCSFGRTVTARGVTAREAVRERILNAQGPVRIVSLACGPAVEMRQLFATIERVPHPVELILIDQDEHALRDCHDALAAVLRRRFPNGSPVQLHCLHFSLRQIVAPKQGAETELVRTVLHGIDMIYSMGLYDYILQPLARRIVTCLARMLRPGGRLFIGNLQRVPDCSWVMDYALAWHLVYRDENSMLDLASEVEPAPGRACVTRDATGHCLFLDVRRAGGTALA